jgi:hypothetical protein
MSANLLGKTAPAGHVHHVVYDVVCGYMHLVPIPATALCVAVKAVCVTTDGPHSKVPH